MAEASEDPAAEPAMAMVSALQASDWSGALVPLEAGLQAAQGRDALLARMHAWAAQALLQLVRLKEAGQHLRLALRHARAAGDAEGLAALQPLQQQLFAMRAAANAGAPLPDTALGRALGALDEEDWERGEALVHEAIAEADQEGEAREQVIARLAFARVPGRAHQAIHDAWAIADASNDMNLVTAVVKAAKAADVELAKKVF